MPTADGLYYIEPAAQIAFYRFATPTVHSGQNTVVSGRQPALLRLGYRWLPSIYAQRLEPATKRPVDRPIEVYHFHSARRSLMNVRVPLFFELSLTADKLFFNMGETTGNIWLAEWESR